MALLIEVGNEIHDRGRDPALGELVIQLLDCLVEYDTSKIAEDARVTIPRHPHLWGGAARRFDLTIDDSDEEDMGEDFGIAALVHGTPIRYTLVSNCGTRRRTAPRRSGG